MSSVPVPPPILRLDEAVVNRIAAGEVIQRPANALKELLENCLDAKANSITVTVERGGLGMMQIADNGTGIRKEDLGIVCQRFTTSKLTKYEDLSSISTYGFRGEALASITHVANLSILTKTSDSACGFKCSYTDGKIIGKPQPLAANQGTIITVRDLFYNVPTRKRALKSGSEEFHRVADVVTRYAVHNQGVAFTLKKEGEQGLFVRTQKDSTRLQNISSLFSNALSKELVELEKSDDRLKVKLRSLISNVNYNAKKFNFLLFINHRLVESSALRKAIEMVYGTYLPKGTHPFVYMSLEIDPRNVDVNVHPTKHEVHFLYQDEIVEWVQKSIDAKLLGSNVSRTFYTHNLQAPLPGVASEASSKADTTSEISKTAPKNLVRTDAKDQKLDRFFVIEKKKEEEAKAKEFEDSEKDFLEEKKKESASWRDIKLSSVKNLRKMVKDESHPGLRDLIANHSFVGCVSPRFTLVQHSTFLYLVDTPRLSRHLFYQILIRDFGNFSAIRLDPPASIKQLALIALDSDESGWTEADGDKGDMAEHVLSHLRDKSEMLDDYFSMEIDEDGCLATLPMLAEDHVPPLSALPIFIMRLITEVNWDEEEACFHTFCRETARFYAIREDTSQRYDEGQHSGDDGATSGDHWKKAVEEVVFRCAKKAMFPPKSMADDMTFVQIANLPDLYKVFERC